MQTSIQDIINELSTIVQQCEASSNRAGYFTALYKRMTEAVLENINAGNFEDGLRMERLDVFFAQRYLNAHTAYFPSNLVPFPGKMHLMHA